MTNNQIQEVIYRLRQRIGDSKRIIETSNRVGRQTREIEKEINKYTSRQGED